MNGFESAFSLITATFYALTHEPGYGIAVWFLAGVFAWSGIVKLHRPALVAMAMVDFGVTRHVQPYLGFIVGFGETALAIALALSIQPQLVLSAASLLLWFFVVLIGRSLWFGERFACFCFGNAEAKLSAWTLIRTSCLALLASILVYAQVRNEMMPIASASTMLQVTTAVSILGAIALAGYIPRLLEWNRDLLRAREQPMKGEIGG